MKTRKFGKNIILVLIFTCLVVLIVIALGSTTKNQRVQAAAPLSNLNVPDSPADGYFQCVIGNIAVFTARIHVQCTAVVPGTTIKYFAASGDSAHELTTNRFLTLMNTAFALGKPLGIYYLTDAASNPSGCGSSDCRAIDWMYINP